MLHVGACMVLLFPHVARPLVAPAVPISQISPALLSLTARLAQPLMTRAEGDAEPMMVGPSDPFSSLVLQKNIIVSALFYLLVMYRLLSSDVPRLFAIHVACMAPMVPLGTAGLSMVRQRKRPPASPIKDPGMRKARIEWLVIRHFVFSAAALYIAGGGLVAIYQQKQLLGKPHLTSWQCVRSIRRLRCLAWQRMPSAHACPCRVAAPGRV